MWRPWPRFRAVLGQGLGIAHGKRGRGTARWVTRSTAAGLAAAHPPCREGRPRAACAESAGRRGRRALHGSSQKRSALCDPGRGEVPWRRPPGGGAESMLLGRVGAPSWRRGFLGLRSERPIGVGQGKRGWKSILERVGTWTKEREREGGEG